MACLPAICHDRPRPAGTQPPLPRVGERLDCLAGRTGTPCPIALVVGCPILVSRTAVAMILGGQAWPYWWLVVAFAVSLLFPSWLLSAAIVGALLATQQTAVAIAALFGIYLFFAVGRSMSVRVMMIAFLIFGLAMLPWVIVQPALPVYLYIGIQKTFALEHA